MPCLATRPDFSEARERPCLRRKSIALSISPFVSARAFLHSIMPAPVRSRKSFTSEAVIVIEYSFLELDRVSFGSGFGSGRRVGSSAGDCVGLRRRFGRVLRRRHHVGSLLGLLTGAQDRIAHESGERPYRTDRVVLPGKSIIHDIRVA